LELDSSWHMAPHMVVKVNLEPMGPALALKDDPYFPGGADGTILSRFVSGGVPIGRSCMRMRRRDIGFPGAC
jgi:hypothetical protein